ncbi:ROK family transcriptional regulator [Flavihumibacter solisilvae]|uniref:ROK family transcriptional regulator n=2 Tax=Flavihumibacter solisilvae TaxID=1349421 RepID=A0A0C1L690_9BACT|nr:ROK family transcriptional regulator [Flavihumibacter solisilvae]
MDKNELLKRTLKKQLYFAKQLSGADLSAGIEKSLPITMKLLTELIKDGEVVELGYAPSTGGRRPMLYTLQKDVYFILTVAMDQLFTRIGIMDMEHKFVAPVERIELPLADNPGALRQLAELIEDYITRSGIEKSKIAGLGIGMPGFIDVKKGINYSFLDTPGSNVVDYLEQQLMLPVHIDNDSSLIALAELKFGAARNKRNVMVVNISWGVGLGLLLNGELFRGQNGFAGEFSHIPVFSTDKLCSCGKTGCLETEASLLVVVQKALKGIREGRVSSFHDIASKNQEEACEAIIRAAVNGDKFCIEVLSEVGYNIGKGVAILIHILNPELIVLSGRGTTAGKLWRTPIQQALNEHCIPRLAENTEIEISTLGLQAELLGAAALVMENFDKGKKKKNQQLQTTSS